MAKHYTVLCPNCKTKVQELPLIPILFKSELEDGTVQIGNITHKNAQPDVNWVKVKPSDELLGDFCDDCSLQWKITADLVIAGGVIMECDECGKNEVIVKENPVSLVLREHAGLAEPDSQGNYKPLVAHFKSCSEHVIGVPESNDTQGLQE